MGRGQKYIDDSFATYNLIYLVIHSPLIYFYVWFQQMRIFIINGRGIQ